MRTIALLVAAPALVVSNCHGPLRRTNTDHASCERQGGSRSEPTANDAGCLTMWIPKAEKPCCSSLRPARRCCSIPAPAATTTAISSASWRVIGAAKLQQNQLDHVIVSHYHGDHSGNLAELSCQDPDSAPARSWAMGRPGSTGPAFAAYLAARERLHVSTPSRAPGSRSPGLDVTRRVERRRSDCEPRFRNGRRRSAESVVQATSHPDCRIPRRRTTRCWERSSGLETSRCSTLRI